MTRYLPLLLLFLVACGGTKDSSQSATQTTDSPTTDSETDSPSHTGDTAETVDSAETADTAVDGVPTINELMAQSLFAVTDDMGEPSGWVELYSSGPGDFSLDGWKLRDELLEAEHPLDGHVVPDGGHLLLWADGQAEQGPSHLSFALSAEGTWLSLIDPAGATTELLSFGALGPDVAASRIPDGGAVFEIAYGGTPGSSNLPMVVEDLIVVDTGHEWRFMDQGVDLGTAWLAPDHDDTMWQVGPSPLGYRIGAVATDVGYGKDPDNKYITTYLRTTVTVKDAAELVQIGASIRKDDGVVVYLNGSEIGRLNMPAGIIDYLTPASVAAVGSEQDDYFAVPLPPGLLLEGDNVLAAEVHQWDPSTSDMIFDLRLTAERVTLAP